jgi:hypothetical protein
MDTSRTGIDDQVLPELVDVAINPTAGGPPPEPVATHNGVPDDVRPYVMPFTLDILEVLLVQEVPLFVLTLILPDDGLFPIIQTGLPPPPPPPPLTTLFLIRFMLPIELIILYYYEYILFF